MTEERLQAYVLGELPPEEAKAVAATIAGDPELQRRELGYRAVREGFRQQRVSSLREELLAFDQTLPPPTSTAPAAAPSEPHASKPAKPRRPWWPFAVAAIFLLALIAYLILGNPGPNSSKKFFIDPPNPATAGLAEDGAEALYFAGDYDNSLREFTQLLNTPNGRSTALFYLPHLSFRLDEHELAALQFTDALMSSDYSDSRVTLLRWNAMINQWALGEDISEDLDQDWPANYPVNALRKALRD